MDNPKTGKRTQNPYIMHHKRGRAARPTASGNAARFIGYAMLAVAMLLIAVGAAVAHEYAANGVTVAHTWARATPGGATIGSAYLEVKAERGKGDRLIGARSPAAGTVELHSHVMEGGIAKMRRVEALQCRAASRWCSSPAAIT